MVNPVPEDSDLQGVYGLSDSDYSLITAGALIRRQNEQSRAEWRGPACLRGLFTVGTLAVAAGGCGSTGVIVLRVEGRPVQVRELANLALAGVWARSADEIFIASPSLGVVQVAGSDIRLERTVAPGEQGSGPVALWGTSPADLYAVGNGRILHRRSPGQWDVERSIPGERQLGVWGSSSNDVYVVGSAGQGAIWHRTAAAAPFTREPIEDPSLAEVVAVWGNGRDDVYAAADGGAVLRRRATGRWAVERAGSPEQPRVRALWGSGQQQLLLAGPGGLVRRRPGPMWQPVLGQAVTGATLRAVALTAPGDGYLVGDAGVVLRLQSGSFSREARGVTDVPLYGVAAAPDGVAYAVGRGGVVLRRDKAGTWTRERMEEPALLGVALAPDGTVFAVGEQGQLLTRRGGLWQQEARPLTMRGDPARATLRAVAVLPDGTVVAAGDEDTVVWRPPGAAGFSVVSAEPGSPISYTGLQALRGREGPELLASASGAAFVLRFAAGRFTREPAPLSQASAIFATSASDIYLSGRDGSVWHFDGYAWGREPVPLAEPLLCLGGAGSGESAVVLAAGEQGFMIQRN
jgi:photosystem II stability/assembly factor-like uncharacterized protein